jgi:tetratricopeptide (TPR) repeat protein
MTFHPKHIVFSLVPVALLLLVLLAAEFVLRAFDVAPPPPLVTEVNFDGVTWYQTNRGYLAKYFPAGTPLIPEFKTTLFRKEKTASTFRIMCLGSSSMFGTPYDMNANIPGIVRKQLRRLYPDVEVEVVNWGASAINSNVIRDFTPSLLQFKPDLVLIYMGHNEFYGPDGIGASFLERYVPTFTRVKYAARELHLLRVLTGWLGPKPGEAKPATTLMREVSQGQLVKRGTTDEQRVFRHFEENLGDILRTLRQSGVPVLVGSVASNLMFPPFVSDSTAPGDSSGAAALFERGTRLRSAGHSLEARLLLAAARDADLLKFRAPGEISEITRRVCAREGVKAFSCDSVLSAYAVDGIAGDTLFWEHLHPTAQGYYRIANAFVAEVVAGGYVSKDAKTTALIPFNADSLSVCWLDLAYGEYCIRHLTGNWPFEDYRRETPVLDRADNVLSGIVAEVHARKRAWNEACYSMATYFWRVGRMRDALTTYEALLEEYPFGFYPNYLKGSLLNALGRVDDAVQFYQRSIDSNPDYNRPHLDLGLILVNRGEYDAAERELTIVIRKSGDDQAERRTSANAHYGLAALRANRGDRQGALKELDQALALAPGYPDALRMRSALTGGAH